MTGAVAVEKLVVGYNRRAVASLEDFGLAPERVTLVVGPNGSGKTTLLKTLAGLLPPVEGRVLPPPRRGAGGAVFVHSSAYLFAGRVAKNMLLAARRTDRARASLATLGVADLWAARVGTLSTGQRQRVALARALAVGPSLLLVDEPEGGMDTEAIQRWREVMRGAIAAGGPTVVVAAHRPTALESLPVVTISLRAAASGSRAPFAGVVGRP